MNGIGNLKPDNDVCARVEETAGRLEAAGHTIVPVDNPLDLDEFVYHYSTLSATLLVELVKLAAKTSSSPSHSSWSSCNPGLISGYRIRQKRKLFDAFARGIVKGMFRKNN